jgi:DNA-binding transcriptional LysR family regulator
MNLHLLRLFKEVAVAGSFSRAAEALRISQPAVSKGVRELEAQLGCALLERGSGGVRTTEAGALLLGHARAIFATERSAEEAIRSLRGLETGSLAIGASTTIATYYLPELVGRFYAAHPAIELAIRSANTREVADLLRDREVDLALVEGPVDDPQFELKPWRVDRLIAIAAPGHPLAGRSGPLPRDRIRDELLVVREVGSGTREVVLEAFGRAGIEPGRMMEVSSTEAVKRLVAAGVGLAFVSDTAVADQIASGQLAEIAFEGLEIRRTLTLLTVSHRQPSAAGRAFQRLLEAIPEVPAPGTGPRGRFKA